MKLPEIAVSGSKAGIYFLLILIGMVTNVYAEDFLTALLSGKSSIDIRARFENVDQKNELHEADAFTLRPRLGYGTGDFYDFKLYVEAEAVIDIIDDYNSTKNGKTQYSVVADPDETEINQFFLSYNGLPQTELGLGRQRFTLDNQRFIGNVGWRQLEQTYDAITIRNSSISDTTLTYAFFNGVKDIFSDNVDIRANIFNIRYKGWNAGTLTAYGYFLDFCDAPSTSNMTFGLRFNGAREFNSINLLYTAEYAKQDSYKDGSTGIDSLYLFLEMGAEVKRIITARIGYELLGEDSFSGFETPLATKHAFNGWADQFLNTPTAGLRDYYLLLSGNLYEINLTGVYHGFHSDRGGINYGSELDLMATKNINKFFSAGFKYADYNAESLGVDTEKLWLWLQFKL